MKTSYVIGTRGSELAVWQANSVKAALQQRYPDVTFELKLIKTTGDHLQDVALSKVGDKGLFTRQIETQLLQGEVDLAVHSLKDLQTSQPEGLCVGAVCQREISNDVLISRSASSIRDLPKGAAVATGSLRRRSQLLQLRPDLRIVEIRGNVPTRFEKFEASDLDAMILAYAGVHRLGLSHRHQQTLISHEDMLPAVGQGAVAVEVRCGDGDVDRLISCLNDEETATQTSAERAFLRRLEGGCQVPIAAAAQVRGDEVVLTGYVGSLDGRTAFRDSITGASEFAEELGTRLAERLIGAGAEGLLREAREQATHSAEAVL
jgi:hydroxymethylbilane synthase